MDTRQLYIRDRLGAGAVEADPSLWRDPSTGRTYRHSCTFPEPDAAPGGSWSLWVRESGPSRTRWGRWGDGPSPGLS